MIHTITTKLAVCQVTNPIRLPHAPRQGKQANKSKGLLMLVDSIRPDCAMSSVLKCALTTKTNTRLAEACMECRTKSN